MLEAGGGNGGETETARLTALAPELGRAGLKRLAVQHQPDTRIHVVRSDGTAAVLISDPAENVRCWIEIETDGVIEDVVVMPSAEEDAVYYTVRRFADGGARRCHERWALERECRGGALNLQADSFVVHSGAAASQISGLTHLEGEEVVVWADGSERARQTVADGKVAISGAPAKAAMAGLPYEARYRSIKLAYGARKGTALMQPKRVNRLSFLLADVHADGVRFGPDFANLTPLPAKPAFAAVDPDTVFAEYDFDGAPFGGAWTTDARVCLRAEAPKPVTVLALAIDLETVER